MEKRETLRQMKKETLDNIRAILLRYNIRNLNITDFCEGSSPILCEDPEDDENTFTLDRIEIYTDKDGKERLSFDGSSWNDNHTWEESDLGLDTLIDIEEFLEDWEGEIEEMASNPERDGGICDQQEKLILGHIEETLRTVFPDAQTRNSVVDAIGDAVVCDILETADWTGYEDDEINEGDVEICLQRQLARIIEEWKDFQMLD